MSPERFYRDLSPQLSARLRQMWSARGHDLDRIGAEPIRFLLASPCRPKAVQVPTSRAHDRLSRVA